MAPFFARLASMKKVPTNSVYDQTKFFFYKIKKLSKNAKFQADFKSVEKVLKNAPIKSYMQNKLDEHE